MASCRDVIARHVSIRRFKPDPIPEDDLREILWAAQRAPSAWGLQPFSVVVVRDEGTRARLAEAVGGQRYVAEAPVFLAFVADYGKLLEAMRMAGLEPGEVTLGHLVISLVDIGIASAWATIRAEELGYGTVYIALYSSCRRVAEVLSLPPRTLPVVGLAIGKPAEQPATRPRQPLEALAWMDTAPDAKRAAELIIGSEFNQKFSRAARLTLAPGAYYEKVGAEIMECAKRLGWRI
ncbi:nitroreductase [Pyrolobus fumarii 1A]|uniref:Nitroreductase n=1 Tax=Pyrolobus fumarii (strain DSM 11204 / 1A) TaxID=694429 RepID=G0EDM9_PYRF1|nr:nitroreductase family protein [Pyrolobus fumarii]AEM39833.1 nitroreductase [Pyrolobus fumarii 1A]